MVDEKAEGMLRRLRKWGFTCLYPRRRLDSDSESEDEVALPETDPVLDLEGKSGHINLKQFLTPVLDQI